MKKAKFFGNAGMALTAFGILGLVNAPNKWIDFYLIMLSVAAALVVVASIITVKNNNE